MAFVDKRLGERIRELRTLCGWSQIELGQRTGSNRHAVSRDERTGQIGTKRVLKYAEAFGITSALILEVLEEVNNG